MGSFEGLNRYNPTLIPADPLISPAVFFFPPGPSNWSLFFRSCARLFSGRHTFFLPVSRGVRSPPSPGKENPNKSPVPHDNEPRRSGSPPPTPHTNAVYNSHISPFFLLPSQNSGAFLFFQSHTTSPPWLPLKSQTFFSP